MGQYPYQQALSMNIKSKTLTLRNFKISLHFIFENLMKKHKLDYDKIGVLLKSKKSKKRIKFIGKLNFND